MPTLIIQTPCCNKKIRQGIVTNFDATFRTRCPKCGHVYDVEVKSKWAKNGDGDHWINWKKLPIILGPDNKHLMNIIKVTDTSLQAEEQND